MGDETSWPQLAAEWAALPRVDYRIATDRERRAFEEALGALRERAVAHARRDQNAFWDWFLTLKQDDRQNGSLVGNVLWHLKAPVPKRAFASLLRAAIEEPCPSFNRTYVAPAVRTYGRDAVIEALVDWLERGTPAEKAGAANALYWAKAGPPLDDWEPSLPPDEGRASARTESIRSRERIVRLQQFVGSESVEARRSLLAGLCLDESAYPIALRPLVARAIEIARTSDDDYLRHRVEIQLGRKGPFMALPDRTEE